ncbi:hypothetical protein TNCV_4992651 [Trichonephila clavipes]|nr:hypothetical protein TNCV_4992651 [Trichonephila clavipes]
MASSAKEQKVQDSECNKEFQTRNMALLVKIRVGITLECRIVNVVIACNGAEKLRKRTQIATHQCHMKSLVFEMSVPSVQNLIARKFVAAERILIKGIFQNVGNSMQRRCQVCQMTSSSNFDHLL